MAGNGCYPKFVFPFLQSNRIIAEWDFPPLFETSVITWLGSSKQKYRVQILCFVHKIVHICFSMLFAFLFLLAGMKKNKVTLEAIH